MQRHVVVGPQIGLHARPAAALVAAAAARPGAVRLGYDGQPLVDAKSILSVLTLGAKHGQQLVLEVDGDDDERALDDLARLIEQPEPMSA